MRVNKAIVIVAATALLAWGLGAKDDEVVKLGVFDLDHAVNSTDEGKAAREELERKMREADASLQPLRERFQELMKDIEAKKFVLSDEALFQKQLDVAELQNQMRNKQQEVKGQLEVDRERLVGPLRTKLAEIVEEVGRENGFSLILLRNSPGVWYSREALDVTDMIIEKFNEKS